MHHLKWIALAPAAVGIIFLFFGIIWTGAVQLGAAAGLLALAACIWRVFAGQWQLVTEAGTSTP